MLNSAGANWFTCTENALENAFPRATVTVAGPASTSHGTCAVICPPETMIRGDAIPLMVTADTSASDVESVVEPAEARDPAREPPKMDTSEPGATPLL